MAACFAKMHFPSFSAYVPYMYEDAPNGVLALRTIALYPYMIRHDMMERHFRLDVPDAAEDAA